MKTQERGLALLLVLVILAIGSVVTIPLLRLAYTQNKIADIANVKATALYTLDGAQEYVMWKLLHQDWAQDFTESQQVGYLEIINCGTNVTATITMRAIPGEGGMVLALEDARILPTKSVSPTERPHNTSTTYTYTINLEHLSSNTTQPLEAIYDVPPGDISSYVVGSSKVRIDGGEWLAADDPDYSKLTSSGILLWPDGYDKDTGEGGFSSYTPSPNGFHGLENFTLRSRQINELQFQVEGSLKNGIECNWVVLKPWNTVSGPQAPINIGDQEPPIVCDSSDSIVIVKTATPDFITPGVEEEIQYDIAITNNYGATRTLDKIIDYLPPGFEYKGPTWSTDNYTDVQPSGTESAINVNGVQRYVLEWGEDDFPNWNRSLNSGQTIVLSFLATATKDVSGSYYNEVSVILAGSSLPAAFSAIGLTPAEYNETYSWDQGSVTVPTYDVTTEEDGVIVDSNLSLIVDGISISSFNIR